MIWWAQGHTSYPAGLHTYKSCLFQVSGQRGKVFLSQPAPRMNITRMLTVCTSPLYISKRYRIFNLGPAVQYTLIRVALFRLFFNAETQCELNGAPVQSLWPQNTSPLFPANCITLLSSSLGSFDRLVEVIVRKKPIVDDESRAADWTSHDSRHRCIGPEVKIAYISFNPSEILLPHFPLSKDQRRHQKDGRPRDVYWDSQI